MLNTKLIKSTAIAVMVSIAGWSLPVTATAAPAVPKTNHVSSNVELVGGKHHRRYYKGKRHYRGHHYSQRRYYKRKRSKDYTGAAVAAGIAGLAIGAIIAGSNQQRTYHAPRRQYRQANTHYGRPKPYTGEWYRYCASKYRSFDARSGTFMSYSGVRKLCR
ncbi:MAG: BA14K family protein [Pseudomonadota bacterium]